MIGAAVRAPGGSAPMPVEHVVKQGEHLAGIAQSHGFTQWEAVWDAPENRALREQRKNPNVLLPGDRLFIPERQTREESGATNQRHRFTRTGPTLKLRIALHGLRNQPLAGHEGTLSIESQSAGFTTGSDGMIERGIPPDAQTGTLIDRGVPPTSPNELRLDRTIEVQIGRLDPVTEVSGQIARLNNLGYDAGDLPEQAPSAEQVEEIQKSLRFRSAVEEFQCDFKLVVDGKCGKNTQAKLVDVHGS
jgi:N-acetylmuramoyl-L-alanine amidase